jgi:ribosomal protein L37AE/L43A
MLAMRQMAMQAVGEETMLKPACPSCGRALRLSRITPGTDGLADLRTYACRECGVWVTEADSRAERRNRR